MSITQENLMWMAGFWDLASGDYARGQDWHHQPRSMWDGDLERRAKLRVSGLRGMKNARASSVQCLHTP